MTVSSGSPARAQMATRREPFRFVLSTAVTLAVLLSLMVPVFGRGVSAQETPAPVTEGEALVRVIHASPDAPAIDVYVDDELAIPGLTFGTASDFVTVASGKRQIRIAPAGTNPDEGSVIDESLDLKEASVSDIAAVGLLADIKAQVYDLDLSTVDDPGNARVRVIHASPDAGKVDVVIAAGDTLFEGADYPDATDYKDLAAGSYNLEVKKDDAVVLQAPDVAIEAGMVYELVAVGQVADKSLQLISLSATAQIPCSTLIGVGTATDACVRVVHASPDAPAVDIFVDDTAVVKNVAFGTASEYLNVPNGEHQIRVVPTGQPADQSVIDLTKDFKEGKPYLIAAVNRLDDIEGKVYDVNLSPISADQSRVRVVHASPDAGDVDVAVAGGDVLFEGASFPDATNYAVIDAGTYDLEVRSTEDKDVATAVKGLKVEGGMVYDIIAIGLAEDQSLKLLSLVTPASVAQDETAASPTPAAGAAPTIAAPTPAPVETVAAAATPAP